VRTRFLVMVLTFSGMMLMIVGLSNHTTMESGGIEQYMYPFWSFMAAIGGAILVTAGLSYLTYVRHPTEAPVWPIDMAMERLERLLSNEPATVEPVKNGDMLPAPTEGERELRAPEAAPIPERELVLRLLTGDERVLFKTLLDSGGEAYQKDLVLRTKMSDTKTSRTIDRLEEKGLVARERHGMSNLIRIIIPNQ
jgi:hypothetical protein